MAKTLASLGAQVFITSRRESVLQQACKEISEATGNKEIAYFPSDVRHADQIEQSIDECVKRFGQLPTLIVNNAAGNFISPTERLSANAVKTIVDIVLLGTLNTTLSIGKRIIKEGKRNLVKLLSNRFTKTHTCLFTCFVCVSFSLKRLLSCP